MEIRAYNVIVMILVLFMTLVAPKARADSASSREYQIKAAFLYNFIMFVDWPEEKMADNNEPIIVGIIGEDPFGDAFEPIEDKLVKGKNVVIKRFGGLKDKSEKHPQIEAIRACHVSFICRSEEQKLKETINMVKDHSILTVADMQGFLKSSGMVNFIEENKKIGFEINVTAANRAKLKIRAKLLRLAKNVVDEKTARTDQINKGIRLYANRARYNNKG